MRTSVHIIKNISSQPDCTYEFIAPMKYGYFLLEILFMKSDELSTPAACDITFKNITSPI